MAWDGLGASALVALAAGDAGVVDGVAPTSCGWHHVVRFWAARLECGSPCEWLAAVWAVCLSIGLCEVEDAGAPVFVACCAGAGGAGSWGHVSECSMPACLVWPRCVYLVWPWCACLVWPWCACLVVCVRLGGGVVGVKCLAVWACYCEVSTFVGWGGVLLHLVTGLLQPCYALLLGFFVGILRNFTLL